MTARRSTVGSIALALAGISALGFLILAIGNIANIEGADEAEEGSVIWTIAWLCFSLGAVLALLTGIAAAVMGSRARNPETRRAGMIAVGYFIAAIVIFFIIDAAT